MQDCYAVCLTDSYRIILTLMVIEKEIILLDTGVMMKFINEVVSIDYCPVCRAITNWQLPNISLCAILVIVRL